MLLTLLSISSLALITQIAAATNPIPIKPELGKKDITLVFAPKKQGSAWTVVEHKIADLQGKDVAFATIFNSDTYDYGIYDITDIPIYGKLGYLYAADSTKLPGQSRFGAYQNCQVAEDKKGLFAAYCAS